MATVGVEEATAEGLEKSPSPAAGDPTPGGNAASSGSLQDPPATKKKRPLKFFSHSVLSDIEDQILESFKTMDEIGRRCNAERNIREKQFLSAHIPESLQGNGQPISDVMKTVENFVVYENLPDGVDNKKRQAELQEVDMHGYTSLVGHGVAAYMSTLSTDHLKKITRRITADCQLWLSRLFRFPDSSGCFHDDERDGFVKICKLALHQKYPKYASEGFEALYSRPPVIYLSAAALVGMGQYLCTQLGLPMSCICTVPCNTMFGASSKMDVAMLEKLIQDDIAAAKTPVLLVAYAGTPVIGHVDNLQRLQDICESNSIWLHVEGNSLATLAMFSVPTSVQAAKSGDSLTLTLGKWLGVPCLPSCRCEDLTLAFAAGLNTFNPHNKLNCLPLWICLQSLGHEGIVGRVRSSCDLAKLFLEKLHPISTIKIVNGGKQLEREPSNLGDLISKTINALLVFDLVTPTIVFRYTESTQVSASSVAPYALKNAEESDEEEKLIAYYNALNTWLADMLQVENSKVCVEAVDIDKQGICLHFSPLESAHFLGTEEADIEEFIGSLNAQIAILDATVSQRKRFQNIIIGTENLVLIEVEGWAGLGAVRYIPESWQGKLDTLPENGKIDINTLNIELVHKLKSTDTAFSLGQTEDGMVCVKFGLITSETDVDELVSLVANAGKEVEESSKFLETMSERIMKGIEEANKDLERENQERIMQEGLLRQVPLVGSLLNWWSPASKENLKGRSFNLSSGKIASTETTYKFHMQIQEDAKAQTSIPDSDAPIQLTFKSSRHSSESRSVSDAGSPTMDNQGLDPTVQTETSVLTSDAKSTKAQEESGLK